MSEEDRKLPRGWKAKETRPTSIFIRDYLLNHRETYPYEIYKVLKNERVFRNIKIGSPNTFYKYINILKKLGLIQKTGKEEDSSKKGLKRIYYKIVESNANSPMWNNPQKFWCEKVEKHKETQPSGEEGSSKAGE